MTDIDNYSGRDFTPVGSKSEAVFLEGPHSRWKDTMFVFKVFREFIHGFRHLHFVGPCITIFGSARFKETHPYYQLTRDVSKEIVKLGFTIITGGGPGIMEAANRGAKEGGGISIGCNIKLPQEQKHNPYLDKWVTFNHFFVRKVLLTKYSYGFIVMPGGYGTMDEFFESITLIQTGKIKRFPVVLMGTPFHKELYDYIQKMQAEQTIGPEDIKLFLFTDSITEAIEHIQKHAISDFGLKKRRIIRPMGILGEKRIYPSGS
jgi:uncharacterized protein (TIGR00730 family)